VKGVQTTLRGLLNLREKQSDPRNPPEGDSVIWQSDGTASGNDGDILIKRTAGGITTTEFLSVGFPSNLINPGIWELGVVTDDGGLDISWDGDFKIYDPDTTTPVITISSGSTTLTDNVANHLVWRSGTTFTAVAGEPLSTDIPIAHISCQDGDIWDLHQESALRTLLRDIQHGLEESFPVFVANGCQVQEDTDATNPFDVSLLAGEYYHDMHEEHEVSQIDSRTTAMRRWYHSAGAWTSDTDAEIDTGFYDDGTNKAAVAVGKYYKWLFFFTENAIHAVYPNVQYNTEADAIDADPPDKPPGLEGLPSSTTYVFKTGDTAFEASTSDRWADVRPTLGVGTGGGGASAWIGLSDTPASFAGQAKKAPVVNAGETALALTSVTLSDGTVAKTGDQDYGGNQAINIVPHQFGTTLPTTGLADKMYGDHGPTGRNVRMRYDSGSGLWLPLENFGTTTVYVNTGSGTDDQDHGGATGAGAYASIVYALSQIASKCADNVLLIIEEGTYDEVIPLKGKIIGGGGELRLRGEYNTTQILGSATATGGTAGSYPFTLPTVTDTGLSAGALDGYILRFDDATTTAALQGITRIVKTNTTTSISLLGVLPAAPASGETYHVEDWGTVINSTDVDSPALEVLASQQGVILENLEVDSAISATGADNKGLRARFNSGCDIYRCKTATGVVYEEGAVGTVEQNHFGADTANALAIQKGAYVQMNQTMCKRAGTATTGINASFNGSVSIAQQSFVTGDSGTSYTRGIDGTSGGVINCDSTGLLLDYATTGARGLRAGGCAVFSNMQYVIANVPTPTSATAPGWIQGVGVGV